MSNSNANPENTVVIGGGNVEYALTEAAVNINELIANLRQAAEGGAEFVVMASGNYRGAQWMSLGTEVEWIESEGDEY